MPEELQETIDVDRAYASTIDSVNLINRMYDEGNTVDKEDLAAIDRNKKHLEIMLAKDFWTQAQNLYPIHAAIDRKE
jgi:hypothetical protein